MLMSCLAYSLALKMEATCPSETSIDFQRATRRYIPEDRTLHNHRCENLRFHIRKITSRHFEIRIVLKGTQILVNAEHCTKAGEGACSPPLWTGRLHLTFITLVLNSLFDPFQHHLLTFQCKTLSSLMIAYLTSCYRPSSKWLKQTIYWSS
jgi:hypothetical protein